MMHENLRILSNSAKFFAGQPLLSAYNCLSTMASTFSTYPLGAVASLKFLVTENIPRITVSFSRTVVSWNLEARNFETAQHIDK